MLKLFEERRFDDRKAHSHAAFIAHPHQARFGLKANVAIGQNKAHIDQPREAI